MWLINSSIGRKVVMSVTGIAITAELNDRKRDNGTTPPAKRINRKRVARLMRAHVRPGRWSEKLWSFPHY